MSANLDVSFEIHDFPAEKADELLAAAKQFLDAEGLEAPDVVVELAGDPKYVRGHSVYPVIISSSYEWVPEVTARWKALAARIGGAGCRALVNVEYPDEG